MLENIPMRDLGYEPNRFDKAAFLDKVWEDKKDKILKRNSSETPSKVRLEKFLRKTNKEDYTKMYWDRLVGDGWDQIIPMHLWHPKSYFDEGTVPARLDHHFFTSFYETSRKMGRNKTLVILPCKEIKPYAVDCSVSLFNKYAPEFGFDLAVASASITPIYPFDASRTYPFNIYNWPGNRVGEYDQLVANWLTSQLGFLVASKGYERVIFWGVNDHLETFYWEATRTLPHVKIDRVGAESGLAFEISKRIFGAAGLAKLRFGISIFGRVIFCLMFDKDPDIILANAGGYKTAKDKAIRVCREYLGDIDWPEIVELVLKHTHDLPNNTK